MTYWHERFGLIDLRRLKGSDDLHHRNLENGEYLHLTSEIAVSRENFSTLPPWEQRTARIAAAGLTADRAVVASKSAARLWGVAVLHIESTTELILPKSRPTSPDRWPEQVQFRSALISSHEYTKKSGIRVTKVPRTLRDICCYHGLVDGVIAIDSARRIWEDVPFEELRTAVIGNRQFRRRPLVRRALAMSRPGVDSPLETWARLQLVEAGIGTEIQVQVAVFCAGPNRTFIVDILLDGWLAVEIDGELKYEGGPGQESAAEVIRAERQREKYLQNEGLVLLRVGYRDLFQSPGGESLFIRSARRLMAKHGPRASA